MGKLTNIPAQKLINCGIGVVQRFNKAMQKLLEKLKTDPTAFLKNREPKATLIRLPQYQSLFGETKHPSKICVERLMRET